MTNDTTAAGRYDIVVFENRGWECIGKQDAYPPVEEDLYRPKVTEYVQTLNMPQDAGKYTMHYEVKNGECIATWTPYVE